MAASIPVPRLLDVEEIQLSVMPRKEDGHVDAAALITWTSSDAAQVGATPGRIVMVNGHATIDTAPFTFTDPQFNEDVLVPGEFNCVATTPLLAGVATVTASAQGYESADFGPIAYAPGVPRSLNASVGSPTSDL